MKKLRKKVVNGLAMGICCLGLSVTPMFTTTAHALTARIAFSDPTTSAGEEFKVTMKVISVDGGSIGDNSIVIKYDTSYLKFVDGTNATSYGDGTVRVAGKVGDNPYEFAYTLTFKALKQGETNIDVKSWGILDKDNNAASLDKRGRLPSVKLLRQQRQQKAVRKKQLRHRRQLRHRQQQKLLLQQKVVVLHKVVKHQVKSPVTHLLVLKPVQQVKQRPIVMPMALSLKEKNTPWQKHLISLCFQKTLMRPSMIIMEQRLQRERNSMAILW